MDQSSIIVHTSTYRLDNWVRTLVQLPTRDERLREMQRFCSIEDKRLRDYLVGHSIKIKLMEAMMGWTLCGTEEAVEQAKKSLASLPEFFEVMDTQIR